jgi:hypothetical protein
MANADKDTIYVDIDDEITGIIDKVKNSKGKVVAVVLPKRATVFQSIVNMKLLKKAVDSDKKNLVLITSEAGLLPLAGAAGIHVAKTLTSRPEIPSAPKAFIDNDDAIDEDSPINGDNELDQSQPIGQLAGDSAAADGVETLMLDNEDKPEDAADAAKDTPADKKKDKSAKNKKLKVPNFNKFRLALIILVVVLVVLLILFFVLNSSLKKATINIKTNATNVGANLSLILSTNATSVDSSSGLIPAKAEQQQKSYQQTVNTTGQKNEGNEATGTVTMTAQYCGSIPSSNLDVPAGTGLGASGQTFITQSDTTFNISGQHGGCLNYQGTSSTPISAQSPGSAYNVSGVTFTVAGSYGNYTVAATGSASGGTDNIVQTVNQNDINNAKAKISTGTSGSAKSSLESELKSSGYYPIDATFTSNSPNVTSSANVGQSASSVTVTEDLSYTMFGVPKNDLNKLVTSAIDNQIDTSKQSILDNGVNSATYSVGNLTSTGGQVQMTIAAVAGPQLNIASIKKNAEGHKAGDISSQLQTNPNVTGVTVNFSPFWVGSAPSNPSKITVDIAKPTSTQKSN